MSCAGWSAAAAAIIDIERDEGNNMESRIRGGLPVELAARKALQEAAAPAADAQANCSSSSSSSGSSSLLIASNRAGRGCPSSVHCCAVLL
jgi:hypothetical protein